MTAQAPQNSRRRILYASVFILFCIALNVTCAWLVTRLSLPVYLDSIAPFWQAP